MKTQSESIVALARSSMIWFLFVLLESPAFCEGKSNNQNFLSSLGESLQGFSGLKTWQIVLLSGGVLVFGSCFKYPCLFYFYRCEDLPDSSSDGGSMVSDSFPGSSNLFESSMDFSESVSIDVSDSTISTFGIYPPLLDLGDDFKGLFWELNRRISPLVLGVDILPHFFMYHPSYFQPWLYTELFRRGVIRINFFRPWNPELFQPWMNPAFYNPGWNNFLLEELD